MISVKSIINILIVSLLLPIFLLTFGDLSGQIKDLNVAIMYYYVLFVSNMIGDFESKFQYVEIR